MKFLTGAFLTNERLSIDQPNLSPACSLCDQPVESIEHVLVACRATSDVRSRLLPELMNIVATVQPKCGILQHNPTASILTQFILDCTSLNLPDSIRVPAHNPGISAIYILSCQSWLVLCCKLWKVKLPKIPEKLKLKTTCVFIHCDNLAACRVGLRTITDSLG
jgi:hypothetical protein